MKRYNNVSENRDKKEPEKESENEDISLKEVLKTLSLFFVLTVVALLLISGKFRQGVEDFWENNEKAADAIEELGWDELFEA